MRYWSAIILILMAGCRPAHEELAVYHASSPAAAEIAAQLEAKEKGGHLFVLAKTGSMEPTLHGGDCLVGVPTPFKQLQAGMICTYKASWNTFPSTCHRIVGTWPDGTFVMEGDADKNRNTAETTSYMGANNYQFHIVSVHRYP
jgi:hypothetical protein